MKNIYIFGNEYLEYDNLAYKASKQLKERYNLVFCRSPDELLEIEEDEIFILDVIKGIKDPIIINDMEKLKINKMVTLHDLDLAYFLKLMKEMGMNKKIKIIGVPVAGKKEEIVKKVNECI